MPKPVNFDQLYPGRFMKAGQFLGKKVTLTVKDVDTEKLKDAENKDKIKAIMSFNETELQLVCCKTNGLCCRAMFGKELANWIGKRIILFPGSWNGEECVRIWGSPDIEKMQTVTVELPRRKPFPMVMHTSSKDGAAPAKATPPSAEQVGFDAPGNPDSEPPEEFA
jgi:hypothetical protein